MPNKKVKYDAQRNARVLLKTLSVLRVAVMIMESSRLIIREISEADINCLAAMLADEKVMEFSVNGSMNRSQTLEFIKWCQSSYENHGIGPWALENKCDGSFVGFSGLNKELIDGVEEVHVGYRLARNYWQKGFATESVNSVVEHGLNNASLGHILAIIEPEHYSSIRVIDKAGFKISKKTKFHDKSVNIYIKSKL